MRPGSSDARLAPNQRMKLSWRRAIRSPASTADVPNSVATPKLELSARWPFRIGAGLVVLAFGLTFGGLVYDVIRYPHDLDLSLAEWVEVVVSFLVLGAIAFVFSRIAVVGSLLEPTPPPVNPHAPVAPRSCIRCGSFCSPETGAFMAPAAAALCPRCIREIHAALAAGNVAALGCLTHPDAIALQIECSYCGTRNRPGLLAWSGGAICRSCLDLAGPQRSQ